MTELERATVLLRDLWTLLSKADEMLADAMDGGRDGGGRRRREGDAGRAGGEGGEMNLDGTPCGCAWCNPDEATRAELDARWHDAAAIAGRSASVDTYGLVMLQLVMDLFRQRATDDEDAADRTEGLMATVLSALVRDGATAAAATRRDRSGRMN